ncbi:MAG TPA: DUF2157 domain-containing protein [Spirochaetota bacterium]|nr:DUF2157 domain-containing protein [Spirochaetota bacterium]
MLNNNKLRFLIKEVARLKNENLLDEQAAQKLTEYYQSKISPKNIVKLILISLSIFAALLIIGGVTLVVITFNWHIFTKEVKTVLAYLLLLVPQILCIVTLLKNAEDQKKKEIFSLVLSILFGVTIAFVGQIYKLSENTEAFLLIWIISTIVIIYIFNSLSSTVLYMILLISYTSVMQNNGKIGVVFYPLFALIIPFYIMEFKKKDILRRKLFDYILIITVIISLGITLEKVVPGLWIIAYSNLFVVFYLYGVIFEKNDGASAFYSPFRMAGIFGIAILGYIYTFHWPWKEIGWDYYRSEARFNEVASIFDYIISIGLPLVSFYLFYLGLIKKKLTNYILSGFGVLIIFLFLLVSALTKTSNSAILLLPAWLLNLFVIAYCLYFFYMGYKSRSLLTVNGSTIMLLILIITRFFDYDMGVLSRGFAFIGLGLVLVLVNVILSKKFKRISK